MTADPDFAFPSFDGAPVVEGPRDQFDRRSWLVGPLVGDAARDLDIFFNRCHGRFAEFKFTVPATGEVVKVRFDSDSLPMTSTAGHRQVQPFLLRELR